MSPGMLGLARLTSRAETVCVDGSFVSLLGGPSEGAGGVVDDTCHEIEY